MSTLKIYNNQIIILVSGVAVRGHNECVETWDLLKKWMSDVPVRGQGCPGSDKFMYIFPIFLCNPNQKKLNQKSFYIKNLYLTHGHPWTSVDSSIFS